MAPGPPHPQLVLKTTPPRIPRTVLERSRLERRAPGIRRQVGDFPAGGRRLRQVLAARAVAQGSPAIRRRGRVAHARRAGHRRPPRARARGSHAGGRRATELRAGLRASRRNERGLARGHHRVARGSRRHRGRDAADPRGRARIARFDAELVDRLPPAQRARQPQDRAFLAQADRAADFRPACSRPLRRDHRERAAIRSRGDRLTAAGPLWPEDRSRLLCPPARTDRGLAARAAARHLDDRAQPGPAGSHRRPLGAVGRPSPLFRREPRRSPATVRGGFPGARVVRRCPVVLAVRGHHGAGGLRGDACAIARPDAHLLGVPERRMVADAPPCAGIPQGCVSRSCPSPRGASTTPAPRAGSRNTASARKPRARCSKPGCGTRPTT